MQDFAQCVEPAPIAKTPEFSSDSRAAGLMAAGMALGLSACGGGGESGSSSPAAGSPGPPPIPPDSHTAAPGSRPGAPATARQYSRHRCRGGPLPLQAQFSVSDAESRRSGAAGCSPGSRPATPSRLARAGLPGSIRAATTPSPADGIIARTQLGDYMIWNQLLAGPDQMRKRMALALSEMFVVSFTSCPRPLSRVPDRRVLGRAHDACLRQFPPVARGNHAQCRHGNFLNTRGNLKENSRGRQPDENYAREVMQLFTIGLYELNPDGTHKLDADGKPVETYGQEDVTNLARVFTGYDLDYLSNGGTSTAVAWEKNPMPSTHLATNPMRFIANRHSTSEVNFLGTKITGTTPGAGCAAHRARPAFLPRQYRPVLRAADDPAPGDQQSITGLRAARGDGVRQQRLRRAR